MLLTDRCCPPTDYSCALQRDILLQGRLYLSENWICFYSNIFRWETLVRLSLCCPKAGLCAQVCPGRALPLLFSPVSPFPGVFPSLVQLTVRLKDICSMTKEKTARLIPNAIQVCTDTEKVHPALLGPPLRARQGS